MAAEHPVIVPTVAVGKACESTRFSGGYFPFDRAILLDTVSPGGDKYRYCIVR